MDRPLRILFPTLFCIYLLVAITGCAINPVTGQNELMLLDDQDELTLGKETDTSVIDQFGLYQDSAMTDYVSSVGRKMSGMSHRPALKWQFKVMDTPVVNAFAVPGGYIYVTRGLLAHLANEAELAGVLGHEIGHVTARHGARNYSRAMLAGLGVAIGSELFGEYSDVASSVLGSGTALLFLKFSRDDERQADSLGVEYASRAGYDAGKMADFFQTLKKLRGEESDQPGLPDWFSTHPDPANREASVRQQAHDWQTRHPGNYAVRRKSLLQHLDGLVYGQDPRLGYRDKQTFYHPRWKIQFDIPADWTFEQDSQQQITMADPDDKAVALFISLPSASADQAFDQFIESLGLTATQRKATTMNGLPCQMLKGTLTEGTEKVAFRAHAFDYQNRSFVFFSLTRQSDFKQLKKEMLSVPGSFRAISAQKRLKVKPKRIRVKQLHKAMSLQQACRHYGVSKKDQEGVAQINGVALKTRMARGTQIKLIF